MEEGRFKTAFFDLDGTLADNYDAITACVGEAVAPLGFERPSREKIMHTVGGSILLTLQKLVGPELAPAAAQTYMERIDEFVFLGLKPMPFAAELLGALKARGIRAACLTNKSQKSADDIMEKLGMGEFLECVIGTSLTGPRKPQPEFTKAALARMGADAASSILVGDSPYDYDAAQAGRMACALVATGGDTAEELAARCPRAEGIYSDLRALALGAFSIAL